MSALVWFHPRMRLVDAVRLADRYGNGLRVRNYRLCFDTSPAPDPGESAVADLRLEAALEAARCTVSPAVHGKRGDDSNAGEGR